MGAGCVRFLFGKTLTGVYLCRSGFIPICSVFVRFYRDAPEASDHYKGKISSVFVRFFSTVIIEDSLTSRLVYGDFAMILQGWQVSE